MIASFAFELDTYWVNGYAAQENGSMTASRAPSEPATEQREPEQRQQVERDRRRMRSRQAVPAAAPPERRVCGDVCLVGNRPIRVAAVVGRLTAAIRLDALADLAVDVLRPTRLEFPSIGMCP